MATAAVTLPPLLRFTPRVTRQGAPDLQIPARDVSITRPYRLGQTKVTVGQFVSTYEADPRHLGIVGINPKTGRSQIAAWGTSADDMDAAPRFGEDVDRSELVLHNEPIRIAPDRDWLKVYNQEGGVDFTYHRNPVVGVNKFDALRHLLVLNIITKDERTKLGIGDFRLPWEVEWENAALGQTGANKYPTSRGVDISPEFAHYYHEKVTGPEPVDAKPGVLWDGGEIFMAANAWEWMGDVFGAYVLIQGGNPVVDPRGPASDNVFANTVVRAGSWGLDADFARSGSRGLNDPRDRYHRAGFRVAAQDS